MTKILTKEELALLSKDKYIEYITTYLNSQLELSYRKQQSSDNYGKAAWPYLQAEQIGTQKTIIKLLSLIK